MVGVICRGALNRKNRTRPRDPQTPLTRVRVTGYDVVRTVTRVDFAPFWCAHGRLAASCGIEESLRACEIGARGPSSPPMAQLTYFGHACFLIEHADKRVIIDPFISGNPKAPFQARSLPPLDAILVTHGHGDHLGDAVPLAKQNPAAGLVAPYELARVCEAKGAQNVH